MSSRSREILYDQEAAKAAAAGLGNLPICNICGRLPAFVTVAEAAAKPRRPRRPARRREMKRKAKKIIVKRCKPISYVAGKRYGILNHIGGIWTPETFNTESEARRYLNSQTQLYGDLSRHTVTPVRVTVTALRARDGGRG